MDFAEMTDEELRDLVQAAYAEQMRRAELASIPDQIEALVTRFGEVGGDPASIAKEAKTLASKLATRQTKGA